MLIALIAAAHALAASAPQALTVTAAARPAAAVVDRFHAALKKGDAKGALALMADDALIFESGESEQSKAEYQTIHLGADIDYLRGVTEVTTARRGRAAGDLAWIASQGRASGSFNDVPVDRATTETIVLRRSHGHWRIVHIHWSSAKP